MVWGADVTQPRVGVLGSLFPSSSHPHLVVTSCPLFMVNSNSSFQSAVLRVHAPLSHAYAMGISIAEAAKQPWMTVSASPRMAWERQDTGRYTPSHKQVPAAAIDCCAQKLVTCPHLRHKDL